MLNMDILTFKDLKKNVGFQYQFLAFIPFGL